MFTIDNAALILGIVFGGSIGVVSAWAINTNRRVNAYEKAVKTHLLDIQCPLYSFDMMLDGYYSGVPSDIIATNMQLYWEEVNAPNTAPSK